MAVAAGLCLYAAQTFACSCVPYREFGFVGHEVGRLPANAPGIAWFASCEPKRLCREPVVDDRFTLELLDGGMFRELPILVSLSDDIETEHRHDRIYIIAPHGGLLPGATYRVTDHLAKVRDRHVDRRVLVTVDHEKLLAGTELTLDVGPANTKTIEVAAGVSCIDLVEASEASIAAKMPPGAHAWQDRLLYRTIVDGEHWRPTMSFCSRLRVGRSWAGVGRDRLYLTCGEHQRYTTSTPKRSSHAVVMEARLPGTDIVLRTPVRQVKLDCSDSPSSTD